MTQPLQSYRVPLSASESDSVQILRFLERIRTERQGLPYLREFAVQQLRGVDDHDQPAQAEALLHFVKSNVKYVLDPVDSEYVRDPVLMLDEIRRDGEARGDCDDHALLLASLLGSIGINARCVGVKIMEEMPPGEDFYNHVIVQAFIDGGWVDLDPCAKRNPQQPYNDKLILENYNPTADTATTLLELMHTLSALSTLACPASARGVAGFSTFLPTDLAGWTSALGNLANIGVGLYNQFDNDPRTNGGMTGGGGYTQAQLDAILGRQAAQANAATAKPAATEWIPGVPNALVMIGGVGLIAYLVTRGGRR